MRKEKWSGDSFQVSKHQEVGGELKDNPENYNADFSLSNRFKSWILTKSAPFLPAHITCQNKHD